MEWSNSLSLSLIDLYRERECLWNPIHDDYKNKTKKTDAWNEISQIMKCEVVEVKKKMESLLSSFRRERQKISETFRGDEISESTWFAFKHMAFLMDKFTPKRTNNIEEFFIKTNCEYDEESILEESLIEDIEDKNKQEIEDLPEPIPKRKSYFKSSKRDSNATTSKIEEAYAILKDSVAIRNVRDDSTIYGEHVASKHRKYSARTKSVIEHLIGDILFNADMGRYESKIFSSLSSSQNRRLSNKRKL